MNKLFMLVLYAANWKTETEGNCGFTRWIDKRPPEPQYNNFCSKLLEQNTALKKEIQGQEERRKAIDAKMGVIKNRLISDMHFRNNASRKINELSKENAKLAEEKKIAKKLNSQLHIVILVLIIVVLTNCLSKYMV